MLINGYGGLLVTEPKLSEHWGDFAQLMGFSYAFSGLPEDIRSFILERRPDHPSETENLLNNPDGLRKVPDLYGRWNQAVALSNSIDQIRGDPLASSLNASEQGVANSLLSALERTRNYYPWGAIFGRSEPNQQGLDAALNAVNNGLTDYLSRIRGMYDQTQAAIVAREAARQQAAIAAEEAERQRQIQAQAAAQAEQVRQAQAAAEAEAARSRAAAEAAKAAVIESQSVALAVKAEIQAKKDIAAAQAPKILGMPISVVLPVGLAAMGALFVMSRKKPAAAGASVAGYRRRVARKKR